MKVRFLVLAMLLSSSLYACSSSDSEDMVFSCDENIEAWIRENLDEIRTFNREQFLRTAGGNTEWYISLFNAITPKQRRAFWIEKLQETLLLDWSERERGHIQSVLNFFKQTEIFIRELSTEETKFLYSWEKYAEEELNWCNAIIHSISFTLHPVINTTGGLQIIGSDTNRPFTRSGNVSCGCRPGDRGTSARLRCAADGCSQVVGCGSWGLSMCTGRWVICPEGEWPICPCRGTHFFPHPNDPHWFFICVDGAAFCEECPADLHWNVEFETCDYPR